MKMSSSAHHTALKSPRGKTVAIWLLSGVLTLEEVKSYVAYFHALSALLPSACLSRKTPSTGHFHASPRERHPGMY